MSAGFHGLGLMRVQRERVASGDRLRPARFCHTVRVHTVRVRLPRSK
jgi:hypothetical protein